MIPPGRSRRAMARTAAGFSGNQWKAIPLTTAS